MVRRHFVEACPGALPIDGRFREHGDALPGDASDVVEPSGLDRRIERVAGIARRGQQQQDPSIADAKMEPVLDEDGERHRGGEHARWFRQRHLPAQRRDGRKHARHPSDRR